MSGRERERALLRAVLSMGVRWQIEWMAIVVGHGVKQGPNERKQLGNLSLSLISNNQVLTTYVLCRRIVI